MNFPNIIPLTQREPKTEIEENLNDNHIMPCVNWHITNKCNFNCIYCFARFHTIQGMLPKKVALQILKDLGVEKINIAGGEPLLYPHLLDIVKESKRCDLTVALISNGSLLTEARLRSFRRYVDWIGLSLDSCDEAIQHILGRGALKHVSKTIQKAALIKSFGFGLKINTVVTKLNSHEDMRPLIRQIDPDRWKVFQVMERQGENDQHIQELLVTNDEFTDYSLRNNLILGNGTTPKFECNDDMRTSYLMLDPLGRFFHSAAGPIEYIKTNPLNLKESKQGLVFDYLAFMKRGGIYDWNNEILRQKSTNLCKGVV
jgi:radical S-adenosyl methionine domain-containing protein 2